jgi:undecaprenyl-diphosphatase
MITTLANPSSFILVGIAVLIWGIVKKEYYRPCLIVGALALSATTSTTLKYVIMDVRPPISSMVPMFEMDYSFPSGHTLIMVVFLLTLGYVSYSRNFSRKRFIVWILIALLGGSIMALTRLYLGYHWLTDVVASFGLGFVILSIVIFIDRFICDKYPIVNSSSIDR